MSTLRINTLREALYIFVRHPSPLILISLILGFAGGRICMGEAVELAEVYGAVAIMLYWPFQEWWMHRVLLHLPPLRFGSFTHEMSFSRIHRLHHESPKDIPLSFLPVSAVLISLVAFCGLFYLCTHSWAYVCTWMAVASVSTITYEWVHYLTHTDYRPRGRYYRAIWKLHRFHHYKNEKYWFSFTIPWIDQLFGTGPHPRDVPHSPTARDLRGARASGSVERQG